MGEHEGSGEETTRNLLLVRDSEETWSSNVSSVKGLLLLSTSVAICGSFNFGFAVGYTSPVESQIVDDLGLSTAQYSLFGSFLTIGGALGALACGKTSDYLGRKGTFLITDLFSIAGWFAIALSESALSLYLGRLLLGFAVGLIAYVIPVYIAEIAPKDLRGGFVTLNMLMMSTGLCIAYILGIFISWRILAATGIIPNLLQIIGFFFIPESPRWLLLVDKEEEFKAALQRLRGASTNITQEAAEIKEYTRALEQASKVSFFQLFQRKYVLSLTIGIGLLVLTELEGFNGIMFYATSIIRSAGFSTTLGSIMMGFAKVLSVFIAIPLIDKCGRRPILMVSATGLCLSCSLAGISFVLQDNSWLEGFSPYLALIGLLMYTAFYSIGSGTSFLLISEIYPINIKGLAGSTATFAGWVTSGFVAYVFNFSMEWSSAGTFFMLAGVCALTLVFVVKLVPETKGRTLEQIQASLS